MGRYMGLDYGSKTVGVALSDPLKLIASPLVTIEREREGKMRPTYRRITELCRENDVELIVVGDPLNMDGSAGERAKKSREFADELSLRLLKEGLEIQVVMCDERLTTVSADEILDEAEIRPSERKAYIDKIAAAFILEEFMKGQKENG